MDGHLRASDRKEELKQVPDNTKPAASSATRRIVGLDALRGLAVALMLLVNNIGHTPTTPIQLTHSGWSGNIHLADMAFPWFVFCMGVSAQLSAAGRAAGWRQDLRILRRFFVLLAIGALLDSIWDNRLELFTVGVIQTISISYLITTILSDIPARRRLFLSLVGLAAYWIVIRRFPFPGAKPGDFDAHSNFILHINRAYLGPVGLWNFSRLAPATSLALIGSAVGDMFGSKSISVRNKCIILWGGGIISLIAAYLWSLSLPFNKPVWTPSYVLLSAGMAMLVLGFFFLISDVLGKKAFTKPLVVLGANAIILYFLPIVVKELALQPLHIRTSGIINVLIYTSLWWCIAYILYRRRIFVKI